MYVIKRDGSKESIKFDKITARIQKLCYALDPVHVSPVEVAMKVIQGIYPGVTTSELDNLAAETAASLTTKHPDYASSLNNLAGLYEKTGLYVKAEALYLEALEVIRAVLGETHPNYAQSLSNLALPDRPLPHETRSRLTIIEHLRRSVGKLRLGRELLKQVIRLLVAEHQ